MKIQSASLTDQLIVSLNSDGSHKNLSKWAHYIIDNKIPLSSLVELIEFDKPVSMRFSWLIGGICDLDPSVVYPSVTYLFSKRHDIKIKNFDRSLAKMLWLAGIPEEIEGEAVNELFNWLLDAKISVSTKHYAIRALYEYSSKHEEIKHELKIVLEDQKNKNTLAWEKQAEKFLNKLK